MQLRAGAPRALCVISARWLIGLVLMVLAACGGCSRELPVIRQTSTLDALKAGAYQGVIAVADLDRQGSLGLGTLDGLDGELVQVDGVAYHVPVDGEVRPASPEATIPFATTVRFAPQATSQAPAGDLQSLCRALDALAPDPQLFVAARIRGHFPRVEVRSVPKQSPPYPPLAAVVAKQAVFTLEDVSGDMVGFRFPAHAKSYGVDGWHLHFLTSDRRRGGHVLAATVDDATAMVMPVERLELFVPQGLPRPAASAPGDPAAKVE